jgi:hypothetical protein
MAESYPITAILGLYAGALLATLVLSRLMLLMLRHWKGGTRRLLVAHGMVVVVLLLTTLLHVKEGPQVLVWALIVYGPPEVVWLLMDLWRHRGRGAASSPLAG